MLGIKLPKKLLKSPKLQLDPVRALRVIRIQANLIILLVIALAATWVWFARVRNAVDFHVLAQEFEPPVRVSIGTKVFSGDENITDTGIATTPFITLYGTIKDYGLLRDALPDLALTVRGTRVDVNAEIGEFAEKVLLQPGKNVIDLLVWWNGTSQYRQHYTVTYIPANSATSSPATQ
ncbi:hypothetical protein A3E39_04300 [Candidatus Uhrbacteria bacterium RIFCSPHIGHO2_12_FULL_60_25]|uniref:Uncharacterized protein n=1 Tax=Candidatus Uhrbacteria bacterium RIFCSPHIGHO2_12_FULL_60_25 TaxID=1802399 RepID=A0A1F7UIJ4_9BACT|nr:MAG: hypothetical protein A3D73_00850 [Candidatus Uhrbacteria bacterium RIFCSPHIGHO2_02_FULL_60_44]OGL78110.1 MAG: hypothetical protein A3E39_04300 [Candidatus Uhrbacteria bacterium RIFCSPHIGHO2_12_FULL_60_25]